jgi:capsule polysaccharide export protein KpsE/RkpR
VSWWQGCSCHQAEPSNAELLKRIEALSQELTRLKGQIEANNAATTANRRATEELGRRSAKPREVVRALAHHRR